jgi:Uma2 family endonuclease
MSSAEKLDRKMAPQQYAAWEREQPVRHEYFAGEVFAQAGGTRRHSQIATNIIVTLGNLLKEKDCMVHGRNMRIHIEATGYQAYPDVSVVCSPVEGESEEVISNPVLLVEVLSPSTADFDRGGKFGHYRQIPSLQEYLLFWQDEPHVEQHTRSADGLWVLRELVGLDQTLQLISLGQPLSLRDVYDKVEL